jgi:hypothetical protein
MQSTPFLEHPLHTTGFVDVATRGPGAGLTPYRLDESIAAHRDPL